MTEPRSHAELVKGLLAQDAGVTEASVREFTSRLQQALAQAERRERQWHRASWIAAGIVVLAFAGVIPLTAAGLMSNQAGRAIWSVASGIAMFVAIVVTSLYNSKYRPAVNRARGDLQIAMLADLQRQIDQLQQRLEKSDG